MPTYFKPLRRKIGVVTLVMACVFAAGWVRSSSVVDGLAVPWGRHQTYMMISGKSSLLFRRLDQENSNKVNAPPGWVVGELHEQHASVMDEPAPIHWRYGMSGFSVGEGGPPGKYWMIAFLYIPYWSIVTPLTLLSAYLLLSKPRAGKVVEPTAKTV